jgi:hypothetical protein
MASRIQHQIRSFAILASLPIFFWFAPAVAQNATNSNLRSTPKKARDRGQDATIKVDGAAVYEAPNFDAPVIEYLDSGKKAKVSQKIYPGIGGLGTFYKIRLQRGVYGYIADTDVTAKHHDSSGNEKVKEAPAEAKVEKESPKEKDDSPSDEPDDIKNSFYLDRYFGIGYDSVNYAEKLAASVYNSMTPLYVLKMTGPRGILGGLPLDLSLMFTTTAPSFYSNVATNTSGAMIFGDFMPFFTITENKRFYTYWGAGLLLKYTFWTIKATNFPTQPSVQSEELDLGVDLALGVAVKLSQKIAFRLEGKYFWETQRYFGFGAAFEYKY